MNHLKSPDDTIIGSSNPFDKLSQIKFSLSPDHQEELRREADMRRLGHERFMERLKNSKTSSNQKNTQNVISNEQVAVVDYLDSIIKDQHEPTKGRQFSWLDKVEGIDTQTLAVLALSIMFDAAGASAKRTPTITKLGRAAEMEQWALWLRDQDKEVERRILSKVMKDHTSYRYRRTAMKAIVSKVATEREWDIPTSWSSGSSDAECTKVGSLLFNAVMTATKLFEVYEDVERTTHNGKTKHKTIYRIGLMSEAASELNAMNEASSWMEPMFGPMTVPPVPWQTYKDLTNLDPARRTAGVYLDAALGGLVPLVRGANPQQQEMLYNGIKDGSMDPMMRALNAIQATPFAINTPILEAVAWCWDNNFVAGKFPHSKELDALEFPANYDQLPEKAKKRWRLKARRRVKRNKSIKGGIAQMNQDLRVASELVDIPFYVGASWDFRGRVYPVSTFNHCRSDHIKHMMVLANKELVGEQGALWIALKVADLGDFGKISKQSLQARLEWTEANLRKIVEVAQDFKLSFEGTDDTKLYWSDADKPFGFLAACIELTNYLADPLNYESGFPCGLDGSNSGLQHFSALALNEVEGSYVNLVPSDKPADLYETVAAVVREAIDNDTNYTVHGRNLKPVIKAWQEFRVGRKTLKRNVMTKNYGSNLYGFKQQIIDDFMEPINDLIDEGKPWQGHTVNPFEVEAFNKKTGESRGPDEGRLAADYLSRKSWTAVNTVVKGANEGMAFIQALCQACSKEDKLMSWVTPLGFPVVNRYTKLLSKPIKVFLYDREFKSLKRTQVTLKNPDGRLVDRRKAEASCAANHTHSLDSNHLHATVLKCLDNYGIKDFFLIHDSFATTPARTGDLYYAIREAFIDQYDNGCLYEKLKQSVVEQLEKPEKANLPDIPAKGTLDMKKIRDSEYCFL